MGMRLLLKRETDRKLVCCWFLPSSSAIDILHHDRVDDFHYARRATAHGEAGIHPCGIQPCQRPARHS